MSSTEFEQNKLVLNHVFYFQFSTVLSTFNKFPKGFVLNKIEDKLVKYF